MMARQDTKEQDRPGPVVLRQGTLRNLEARRREPEANAKIGWSHMTYYLWPPGPRARPTVRIKRISAFLHGPLFVAVMTSSG